MMSGRPGWRDQRPDVLVDAALVWASAMGASRHDASGGRSVRFSRRVAAMFAVPVLGSLAILMTTASVPARAFPDDQLARGEQIWNNVCSTCHGPDSTNLDAPLFNQPGALGNYANAAEAVQYAIENMPNDNPGSLPQQDYYDAIAYILKLQGIPGGAASLSPDNAASIPTH
jgi:mono/diheme cytochrome c family protein